MRTTRCLVPVAASLVLTACSSADVGPPATEAPPGSSASARDVSEDARVAQYIDSLYDHTAVHSSVSAPKGEIVDCVDFASEPGVRALVAKGATVEGLLSEMKEREVAHGATARAQGEGACPENTVSHVRLTPERIAAAGGLDAYRASLRHAAPTPARAPESVPVPLGSVSPATAPASGGYYDGDAQNPDYGHVLSLQPASAVQGGSSTMVIGPESDFTSAFVNHSTNHTLAQIWVTGGGGSSLQTLEVGWEMDATNGGPYLFVASTQDGYQDYCQNGQMAPGTTSCVTWVPNTGVALYPGASLPASVVGGVQHELTIQVSQSCFLNTLNRTDTCSWDVSASVDGGTASLLGSFPNSGYGTGALSTGAGNEFETGGEVDDGSGDFTEVIMGEAPLYLGLAFYDQTAYVRNFGYYASACTINRIGPCSNPLIQTGATVYTTQGQFTYNLSAAAGAPSWTNWFYYGDFEGPIRIKI